MNCGYDQDSGRRGERCSRRFKRVRNGIMIIWLDDRLKGRLAAFPLTGREL